MVPFFVDQNPYARDIVVRVNELAAVVRRHRGTVAFVVPATRLVVNDDFLGHEVAAAYRASGGSGPIAGRLWRELEIDTDDLLVEKSAPSAFFPAAAT